ncbi:rRNA maturation RNase YbeY [Massilia sp. Dwa41.01b]|uniref:rRNA maturation RNase YbeY n=1 Tax=unclassified Massilia TaxID=2609279 RepID=UPI0015FEF9A8|nr:MULTISPECIES: rRNA maturation RNase YbeY [unclassified Massilia]QNA90384.1 rRNA maturation RNase YbeY [Massilia sp. Dwa41.01b]QNA97610.1 rRNA maturation RNase YbeY [Massilia sp. Se16.2.3]
MQEKNHELDLDVQYPDARLESTITPELVERWVRATLLGPAELTIRFVDSAEGQTLNRTYRGKDYATNVLTFAYNEGEELGEDEPTQADIILCTDVLQREAEEQKKTVEEHAAHLVVHGVLHAQGYDHEVDEEAEEMEQFERDIMEVLGYPDPYADNA